MKYHAEVIVMPKAEVADPKGQAIQSAVERLQLLGEGTSIGALRVGKKFSFDVEATGREAALKATRELADKLLANPNIETYEVSLGESP